MKKCIITIDDYRRTLPYWSFSEENGMLIARHPLGVELRKPIHFGVCFGDKEEILDSMAKLYCDLATDFSKDDFKKYKNVEVIIAP